MSSALKLRFEWLDAPGVRDEALAQTMARLEVQVGDETITRAHDRRTSAAVRAVHVSLLPLAMWAVDNWWFISSESVRSDRVDSVRVSPKRHLDWHRRHGWFLSREGFSYPEVVFSRADRGDLQVQWFSHPETSTNPIAFLSTGRALVGADVVETEFRQLVEGVLLRCSRLESPQICALRERWSLILDASEEEHTICTRAARLGLDAYDESSVEDRLVALLAGSPVAAPVFEDLLDATFPNEVSDLQEQAERFRAVMATGAGGLAAHAPAPRLSAARDVAARLSFNRDYQAGYELASRIRHDVLGLDEDVAGKLLDDAVATQLLPPADVRQHDADFMLSGVRALVGAEGDSPFVLMRSEAKDERVRFEKARSLYLLSVSSDPHLVTSGFSALQRASRAFAAEWLAPSALLRKRVSAPIVSYDEVMALATELNVSPRLVEHQIENHEVAEVLDA